MCYPFKRRPGTDTAKGCAASPHWTYADEKKVPFLEGSAADEAVFKFVVMPHMGGWWFMMTLLIFENDDGGWWLADIQPKDIKPSLTSRRVGHPVRHLAESDIQPSPSDIQPSDIQPRDIQSNQTSSRVLLFDFLQPKIFYLGPNKINFLYSILISVPKF